MTDPVQMWVRTAEPTSPWVPDGYLLDAAGQYYALVNVVDEQIAMVKLSESDLRCFGWRPCVCDRDAVTPRSDCEAHTARIGLAVPA